MTKTEYRRALKVLALSLNAAGPVLGVKSRASFRYAAGSQIPETTARLIHMFLRHGIPDEWRRKLPARRKRRRPAE